MLAAPDWFDVTPALIDLLREHRIFTALRPGVKVRIPADARLERYSNILVDAVLPRAMGAFSYSVTRMHWELSFGRYCSVAQNVVVMGSRHPADWASTSPFSHHPQPVSSIRAYLADVGATSFLVHRFDQGPQPVTIGHDVWIGADVMLKRGITIGTGAIIGARSVVTKDVPPYAIMGGTPARLIRFRFPETTIARLLASQWWEYGPDQLQPLDVRDPEIFLERLERAQTSLVPLSLTTLTGEALIAAARSS